MTRPTTNCFSVTTAAAGWTLILVLGLLTPPIAIRAQERSDSPAEQLKKLVKEHQLTSSAGVPLTDEERMKLVGKAFQQRYKLGQKLVELAQAYPQDSIALDALIQAVWQVNTTPWPAALVGADSARAGAFEILQHDHVRSDKLGSLCRRISYGFCREYETFLRAVLEQNPHRDVQGVACLSLAHFLYNRLQRLDLIEGQPELTKEFADLFGSDYLAELQRINRTSTLEEIESLLEQANEKYADVKIPGGEMVGEKAIAELFEIRNLQVGMEAPDIEGVDQEGVSFKLRDYRGKVVLLDFWHQQ